MVGGISGINPYVNNYQSYNSIRMTGASRRIQTQALYRADMSVASGRAASPGTPVEPVQPVPVISADASRGVSYMIPFLRKGMDPAEFAVRMRIQYGEEECGTCESRKYKDGSNDPGVSYKTPTHITPEQAASAVMGHEMEHVVREQAKAVREDRRVVSQSVTVHTAICPECGKVYVSGGTTRTATAGDRSGESASDQGQQNRASFSAIA